MAFTQGIYTDERLLKKMLQVIHELEPSGVGARDLQECLMLQLKHKTQQVSRLSHRYHR
jgi:RNA polymerase sigma-54 factor